MGHYEFSYIMEELMGFGILSSVLNAGATLLRIAAYILTSLGLYTVARRRGLNRPWLAWIPVVNCWIIGSLSDQYRYVVKGEIKSKRKVLLVLNILAVTIGAAAMGVCTFVAIDIVGRVMQGAVDYPEMMEMILGPAVGIVGLSLPLAGLSIAYVVIRYMALYDIYRSMDPVNCVLFTVLSILFNVTEPFFLFFNRNKDLGMPPRRQETVYQESVYIPTQPVQEPWEDKSYL
jgi:hypothetical protein